MHPLPSPAGALVRGGAILILLAAIACDDPPTEPARRARGDVALVAPDGQEGGVPLVVGTTVRGVARLEVEARGEELKEPARWEFENERPEEAEAWGGIALGKGKYEVAVRGYDREGRELAIGELGVVVDGELVSQVHAPVKLHDDASSRAAGEAQAYAGSYRVVLTLLPSGERPGEVVYGVHAHDAYGERLPLSPGDVMPWPEPEPGTFEVTYGSRELMELILRLHPYKDSERPPPPQVCIFGDLACAFTAFDYYVKVVVEGRHSCAIRASGLARCWGDDSEEVLGGTATLNRLSRLRLTDIDTHVQHSCGVDITGVAWCWGFNGKFQLGNQGPETPEPQAVTHPAGGTFRNIAVGKDHTCAVDNANVVWCWGGRDFGQLGDGNLTYGAPPSATPKQVQGISAQSIDAGDEHTCVVTAYTTVACWGWNGHYQLLGVQASGTGCATYSCALPVYPGSFVFANRGVVAVSAGGMGTCAVDGYGTQYCWGQFHAGGGYPYNYGIQVVDNYETFTRPAHGQRSSCAITTSGTARCWGYDDHGELGRGMATRSTYGLAPGSVVTPPAAFSVLATGGEHACGIERDGTAIWCWGHTGLRLGFANTADVTVPTKVTVF